jgi:16S rRNA (guanine527-N7)-methyltransferase
VQPGLKSLETILRGCGILLDPAQLDQLWHYHRLLREANVRLNLTRIHNFENMVLKHYVDSLLVLNFLDLPSPLVDMGSGAGLPGIPLKIARAETRMILAEPRGARAEFLTSACHQLGLEGIEVYPHKLGADYPGKVDGVISRAVAEIPESLERVASCLEPGGRMIFMKGPSCDSEIEVARRDHLASFLLVADHAYEIPGTPHHRRLLIYQRQGGESPPRFRPTAPAVSFPGTVREVSSASNSTFRLLRDLLGGRGVRKHGQAIVSGPRIVAEVLDRFRDRVTAWITGLEGAPPPYEQILWFRLANSLFKELDVAGTHAPLLLVTTPRLPQWSEDRPWPQGCTLFIPFQDPENVGAVIRSAAAFGAAQVVLLREAAHPFHPRSSRAAGTALFQVPLLQGPSVRDLRSEQVPLLALDISGQPVGEEPFPITFGLVVGVEGPGLPESLRNGLRMRIPIDPAVESLNAATAAAIALYAWSSSHNRGPCE